MTRDDLRKLWENPANWNRLRRYQCEDDPRLIVPKRFGFGWTLNWSHALAWPFLVVMVTLVVGGALGIHYIAPDAGPTARLIAIAAPVLLFGGLVAWLSARSGN
jgi:hypothetical protein